MPSFLCCWESVALLFISGLRAIDIYFMMKSLSDSFTIYLMQMSGICMMAVTDLFI